ncbi:MAG: hypothetical protein IPP62_16175 [bacterium]|nr:hypothetical protein [bacterium]
MVQRLDQHPFSGEDASSFCIAVVIAASRGYEIASSFISGLLMWGPQA